MKLAVFFDRDGVINELIFNPQHGTVDSPMLPSEVKLVYGIGGLIKGVKALGFTTIICSNQPAVALDKTSLKNLEAITKEIKRQLKAQGGVIDYQYYCLHHPYAKVKKYKLSCDCRKPRIGLFLKAAKEHDIDLSNSWVIGDGVNDVVAGNKTGCKNILLANTESMENLRLIQQQLGDIKPDFIIKRLPEAIKIIKKFVK